MLTLVGTIALHFIEDLIRHVSGPLGIVLRRLYYRRRFQSCGSKLRVETGVYFVNPEFIRFGQNACIDKNAIITAGPAGLDASKKLVPNADCIARPGEIIIGSDCHIGIGAVLQGHGGISIGDNFTCSAFCAIFSLSNDPYRSMTGTVSTNLHYVETPVAIGNNVWLGLQTIVIGNTIGHNCFVMPKSLVSSDVAGNQIAEGTPAVGVKPRFGEGS